MPSSEDARINYDSKSQVLLRKDSNQALGIAQYAIDFLKGSLGSGPSQAVFDRVQLFHTDATLCGLSALALRTNAPTVLRDEALRYPVVDSKEEKGATVYGSSQRVLPEKAILASASAVREWDSNGTVFGYNEALGNIAGEFGHNDFYGVAVSACQQRGYDGKVALLAMICIDEIRGRLCEVFALNRYKIDHVVHGAIASAAVYGALHGATAKQIEYAIGMFCAHYCPWRAIRAGHQLSDSKGASAAISTEAAILCMMRAMRGFVGPADIFRNPLSLWRRFEPTDGDSPFDLVLSHSGDDFAVMAMHFKLGLYEHQSAGALQGAITLLLQNRALVAGGADSIANIEIVAYEPAFSIIGDPAKRSPTTRQSADHSMVYIVSTLLRKGFEAGASLANTDDGIWQQLMLMPADYANSALINPTTRAMMNKIQFTHGGQEYDDRYPRGIPTSIVITTNDGARYESGLVMFPGGHARNTANDLNAIMQTKVQRMAEISVQDPTSLLSKLNNMAALNAEQLDRLYSDLTITYAQDNLFEPLNEEQLSKL